jgi:hypothetical protein
MFPCYRDRTDLKARPAVPADAIKVARPMARRPQLVPATSAEPVRGSAWTPATTACGAGVGGTGVLVGGTRVAVATTITGTSTI